MFGVLIPLLAERMNLLRSVTPINIERLRRSRAALPLCVAAEPRGDVSCWSS
jgi:hypothetical protein